MRLILGWLLGSAVFLVGWWLFLREIVRRDDPDQPPLRRTSPDADDGSGNRSTLFADLELLRRTEDELKREELERLEQAYRR